MLDLVQAPMVEWRQADPFQLDSQKFKVFSVRDGDGWQVVQYELGSTDV